MNQSNTSAINGLSINLLSFSIPRKIILDTDELRIKVKTAPDGNKVKHDIKAKKMRNSNLIYQMNITNQAQTLNFVFCKKTYLSGNKIIGTSSIDISELTNSTSTNNSTEPKVLDIHYPVERQLREQQPHEVIGQMKFTYSLSSPLAIDQESKKTGLKSKRNNSRPSSRNYSHKINV